MGLYRGVGLCKDIGRENAMLCVPEPNRAGLSEIPRVFP